MKYKKCLANICLQLIRAIRTDQRPSAGNNRYLFFFLCLLLISNNSYSQAPLLQNVANRETISLNGTWQYIIDPYETGFYNYRYAERNIKDKEAYWNSDQPENKTSRVEFAYTDEQTLQVPGDWNSQAKELFYYEGTIWYKKSFDVNSSTRDKKLLLHFAVVNYECHVYLNGYKLGQHKGGFTSFNFEIPDSVIRLKDNYLVVKVDNKRYADEVPTLNTDWWNYGGITRDVQLVLLSKSGYISDYSIGLSKNKIAKQEVIEGWVRIDQPVDKKIVLDIPELKIRQSINIVAGLASFSIPVKGLQRWNTDRPKLYNIVWKLDADQLKDQIGFRTIEVKDAQVLLNDKPVFFRGICSHEELAVEGRRAFSRNDDRHILQQARELHSNMVRLAHYPYNEQMARVADSMGILLWSEIPVYWTINFSNPQVLSKAKLQLKEMIDRDRNRASIIIWSVGNETPVHAARTSFMKELAIAAKQYDSSRLVSAALELHRQGDKIVVDDPLGNYTDLISVNEYLGWYGDPLPNVCREITWDVRFNKPFYISETGAEAMAGFHADSLTRWSEEYQEWYYREQVAMFKRMPANFIGLSPWILNDFRSPKRNNPWYQKGWNNKGVIGHDGQKKKAFYVLRDYYIEMEQKHP